jgi:hypothetical protein
MPAFFFDRRRASRECRWWFERNGEGLVFASDNGVASHAIGSEIELRGDKDLISPFAAPRART